MIYPIVQEKSLQIVNIFFTAVGPTQYPALQVGCSDCLCTCFAIVTLHQLLALLMKLWRCLQTR
jgi:hypothetical protein